MKKLFAIIMIALIAFSMVFAAETHTIKIKADVHEVVPVFGLTLIDPDHDDYITNAAVANAAPNAHTYTTQYGEGTAYGHTANNQAFDVDFNLDEDGTVTFQALLLNRAKQNQGYTLEFGGGVFNVTRNAVAGTHGPTTITSSAGTSLTGLTIALGDNAAAGTTTNKKINLTFTGNTVNIGNSGQYVLGQAVYAYTADESIDPNADGEFYYADVTLVVTAV